MITKRMEDYLRVIYELKYYNGDIKIKDIAFKLNIKPSSVVEMLDRMKDLGLVKYEKRKRITLTKKGEEIAKSLKVKNESILKFLKLLGVPHNIAVEDAHKMEHILSKETLERIKDFILYVETCPKPIPNWLKNFRYFCKYKKLRCKC